MLEAATWRTMNRRHFAVLEAVYRHADRSLRTEGWDPGDDAEYAAGIVQQVGCQLLGLSIDVGVTKNQKQSNRRAGKAWKSVSPESGARASVFLTLAAAAVLFPEIEGKKLDQKAIGDGRELVKRIFAVPDPDLKTIEDVKARVVETLNDELTREAVERGGLADLMAIQEGQTALSYHAMKLAGIKVDELPAFEPVKGVPPEMWPEIAGLEWNMTFSISFDAVWRKAKEAYLDIAYSGQASLGVDTDGVYHGVKELKKLREQLGKRTPKS